MDILKGVRKRWYFQVQLTSKWRMLMEAGLRINLKRLIYLAVPGLSCGLQGLSCDMWDLVPWPGIELRPQALEAWSLGHWTTREVPKNKTLRIYNVPFFPSWASPGERERFRILCFLTLDTGLYGRLGLFGLQVLLNGKGVNESEGRKDNYEWKRGVEKKKIYPCDLEKSQIELRRKGWN